jgi:hypothetical protein
MRIATLINAAYVGYARNWLLSLKKAGIDTEDLTVYCTDDTAVAAMVPYAPYSRAKRVPGVASMDEAALPYGSRQWKTFVWTKMELMTHLLQHDEPVLFSDVDVIFHRDPTPWFNVAGVDLIAQQAVFPGFTIMCDGFYYAFPTDACRRLFKPSRDEFDRWHNQEELINARLVTEKVKWFGLPTNLFPDGKFAPVKEDWCCRSEDRYITHFNAVTSSSQKLQRMIASKCWFLGDAKS